MFNEPLSSEEIKHQKETNTQQLRVLKQSEQLNAMVYLVLSLAVTSLFFYVLGRDVVYILNNYPFAENISRYTG